MRPVLVLALLTVAACGDDGEDYSAFCEVVEDVADLLREPVGRPESFDELEAQLDEVEAARSALVDDAPDNLVDEIETILETDSDTLRISEQDAVAEARDRVNAFIREECDLAVAL